MIGIKPIQNQYNFYANLIRYSYSVYFQTVCIMFAGLTIENMTIIGIYSASKCHITIEPSSIMTVAD